MSARLGYPHIFNSYFKTSGGQANEDLDNHTSIKYYNGETEITSGFENCDKTVLFFDAEQTWQLRKATFRVLETPTNPLKVNVVLLPDIPKVVGGSLEVVTNRRFIKIDEFVVTCLGEILYDLIDKGLPVSTTKLQLVITHTAGELIECEFSLETFGLEGVASE